MPHRDNDWDELDEREYPEPGSDDKGVDVERCPKCGQWLFEDGDQCSGCGHFIDHRGETLRRPRWVLAVAAVLLLLILLFFLWNPCLGW
jgi:hypothetical protein